jgi:type I restriction enzyme S subunit
MNKAARHVTAQDLLDTIRSERSAAGLSPAAVVQAVDLPKLPPNWAWATIEELSACEEYSTTDGPFGSNLKTDHYVPESEAAAQVITLGNLGVGEFLNEKRYFIDQERFASLEKHHVYPGDLLIAALAEPVGRCCAVPKHILPALVKADCFRFKPHPLVSHDYLMNYFNSPEGRRRFEDLAHGTGRLRINLTETRSIPVPVPPPKQQRYIAKKQNTLTSHASHANDYLTAIPPLIDQFRQSVLARAFTGELTADWRKNPPNVEPASELLERIKVERREKWIENYARKLANRARKRNEKKGEKFTDEDWQAYFDRKVKAGAKKYEEPEAVDAEKEGLPGIPETWEWVQLDMLGRLETGSTPSKSNPDYYGDFLPFVKPTELNDGKVGTNAREKLSKEGVQHARVLPPGSVLVTCIGATIGKSGLATVECATNQQINAVLPFDDLVRSEWLYSMMCSPQLQSQIVRDASATTLPILNKTRFGELCVALPPVEEQQILASEIEEAGGFMQSVDHTIEDAITELERLSSSMLSSALTRIIYAG